MMSDERCAKAQGKDSLGFLFIFVGRLIKSLDLGRNRSDPGPTAGPDGGELWISCHNWQGASLNGVDVVHPDWRGTPVVGLFWKETCR